MDTYLFSIHPKWCEKIFGGEKTIEVRKTAPKPPFKVVVYCTKRKFSHRKPYLYVNEKKAREGVYNSKNKFSAWSECRETLCINAGSYCEFEAFLTHGKVIGEFVCDKVDTISVHNDTVYSVGNLFADKLKNMCLTVAELKEYLGAKNNGYAIGITAPVLYDEPKELGEFYRLDDSGDDCCCGCIYHEIPMNEYPCCKCNGDRKYLTHAPQSYMRIQDTKED